MKYENFGKGSKIVVTGEGYSYFGTVDEATFDKAGFWHIHFTDHKGQTHHWHQTPTNRLEVLDPRATHVSNLVQGDVVYLWQAKRSMAWDTMLVTNVTHGEHATVSFFRPYAYTHGDSPNGDPLLGAESFDAPSHIDSHMIYIVLDEGFKIPVTVTA